MFKGRVPRTRYSSPACPLRYSNLQSTLLDGEFLLVLMVIRYVGAVFVIEFGNVELQLMSVDRNLTLTGIMFGLGLDGVTVVKTLVLG